MHLTNCSKCISFLTQVGIINDNDEFEILDRPKRNLGEQFKALALHPFGPLRVASPLLCLRRNHLGRFSVLKLFLSATIARNYVKQLSWL